jgi:hypothetical protein
MMAIGDDLFTMLGLIPARDRAGIARGTMADEAKASMAANGNAEGRQLIDGGARPPAIALPPQMRGGGDADIKLPDNVAAEYAAGKGGGVSAPALAAVPPPQERVIASGPAAAPPPGVVRNSDIILEAARKEAQQRRMMQIISGIGQMVSGATGHAGGGQVSAGGGSSLPGLADILKMRDEETAKENVIEHAKRTQHLTDADARALYATGALAARTQPEEMHKAEKIREQARMLREIEPHMGAYAAAVNMDEAGFRALFKRDPDKAFELIKPGSIEAVRKQREENIKTQRDREAHEVSILGKDPKTISPDELSPTAFQTGANEAALVRAKASPEAAATAHRQFMEGPHKTTQGARDYLEGTGKRLGDNWNKDMVAGTLADTRQGIMRAFETFGLPNIPSWVPGMDMSKFRETAAYKSALGAYVTDRVKMLPGAASDKEGLFARVIAGDTSLQAHELREVVRMNEMAHRQDLASHDKQVRELQQRGGHLGLRFGEVPTFTPNMPEPSKILKDDIQAKGNEHWRDALKTVDRQLETAQTTQDKVAAAEEYNRVKSAFDTHFGAETSTYYLKKMAPMEKK